MNQENTILLQPATAEASYQAQHSRLQELLEEKESLKSSHTALMKAKLELRAEHEAQTLMRNCAEKKFEKTLCKPLAVLLKKLALVESSLLANEAKQSSLTDKVRFLKQTMRQQEEVWWASCLTQTLKESLPPEQYKELIQKALARQKALMLELGF